MPLLTAYGEQRSSIHETRCNLCGDLIRLDDEEIIHRCLTCGNTRFYLLDLRTPFYNK